MPFELQRFYDLAGDALRLDYVLESAGNEHQLSEVIAAELAARGEAHHQFLQNFAALGFPRDGLQTEVVATELAPGVFHLTGGSHHSLAVEQADGVVIVEAPLDETRSQAVIYWVETTFPGKAISHVVSSHHHVDHSGGLRTYVAGGATVVMHEAAQPFFEEVFLANSILRPIPPPRPLTHQ